MKAETFWLALKLLNDPSSVSVPEFKRLNDLLREGGY